MTSDRLDAGQVARRWVSKLKPLLFLVAAAALLLAVTRFELGDRLGELQGWVRGVGPAGPAVFIALYVCATVAMVPGSALTLFAGVLFGSVLGTVYVSAGSTLGASLCFFISRYLAREAVTNWLTRSDTFRRLDRLTERRGAAIVAVSRLVPIFPFNLLNYGFGLTRVRFGTYVFWSWLCMLPATVLYVVGGAAGFQALSKREIPWPLVGVVALLVVLLAVAARNATRRLQDEPLENQTERS